MNQARRQLRSSLGLAKEGGWRGRRLLAAGLLSWPAQLACWPDAASVGGVESRICTPPTPHPNPAEELRALFSSFAGFGSRQAAASELDSARMVKLCRDCGLLGGEVTVTTVDLLFAGAKSRGARRISFEQFLTVLAGIAGKKVGGASGVLAALLGVWRAAGASS
jgi:hypothetical protein